MLLSYSKPNVSTSYLFLKLYRNKIKQTSSISPTLICARPSVWYPSAQLWSIETDFSAAWMAGKSSPSSNKA